MDQILKLKLHRSGEILPLDGQQAITAQELESGATSLRIYLEEANTARDHFLELVKPNGSKVASARLVEQSDSDGAYVEVVLGGTLLDMPGRYAIQYCGYVGSEKAVKSNLAFLSVKGSINALGGIGIETLDFVQYLNGVIQDVAAEIVSRNLAFLGTNSHQGDETFHNIGIKGTVSGGYPNPSYPNYNIAAGIEGEWYLRDAKVFFGGADGEIATLTHNYSSEIFSPDGYYWGIDGPFRLGYAMIAHGLVNGRDAIFELPDIDYPEPDDDYSGSTPVPYTLDYQERVNTLMTNTRDALQSQIDAKENAGHGYSKAESDSLLAGKADLDSSGKIPPSQLPSYVDDILDIGRNGSPNIGFDGYQIPVGTIEMFSAITTLAQLNEIFKLSISPTGGSFMLVAYKYDHDVYAITGGSSMHLSPVVLEYSLSGYSVSLIGTLLSPEAGKIYVDCLTNKTYRFTGTTINAPVTEGTFSYMRNPFVEVSKSLAIGETSSTAFAGNRGKALETRAGETDAALAAQSDRIDALEEAIVQPFELLGLGDGEYTFSTDARLMQVADGEYVIITA